jgi:hypothetical protein
MASALVLILCCSSLLRARLKEKAMIIMTGIFTSSLVRVKTGPMAEYSNIRRGILVVDQAPMKITTLVKEAPFLRSMAAIGKATYRGPAAAEPRKKAMAAPVILESVPIYLIKVSLGTHTSRRPMRMKMGGRMRISCRRLEVANEAARPAMVKSHSVPAPRITIATIRMA